MSGRLWSIFINLVLRWSIENSHTNLSRPWWQVFFSALSIFFNEKSLNWNSWTLTVTVCADPWLMFFRKILKERKNSFDCQNWTNSFQGQLRWRKMMLFWFEWALIDAMWHEIPQILFWLVYCKRFSLFFSKIYISNI